VSNTTDSKPVESQSESVSDEIDSSKKRSKSINVATSPFSGPELSRHGISSSSLINQTFQRRQSLSPRHTARQTSISNTCLYALVWAFLLAQLWFHPRFLYLAPVLIFITFIKWCFTQISNSLFFIERMQQFKYFLTERSDAILHPVIKQTFE